MGQTSIDENDISSIETGLREMELAFENEWIAMRTSANFDRIDFIQNDINSAFKKILANIYKNHDSDGNYPPPYTTTYPTCTIDVLIGWLKSSAIFKGDRSSISGYYNLTYAEFCTKVRRHVRKYNYPIIKYVREVDGINGGLGQLCTFLDIPEEERYYNRYDFAINIGLMGSHDGQKDPTPGEGDIVQWGPGVEGNLTIVSIKHTMVTRGSVLSDNPVPAEDFKLEWVASYLCLDVGLSFGAQLDPLAFMDYAGMPKRFWEMYMYIRRLNITGPSLDGNFNSAKGFSPYYITPEDIGIDSGIFDGEASFAVGFNLTGGVDALIVGIGGELGFVQMMCHNKPIYIDTSGVTWKFITDIKAGAQGSVYTKFFYHLSSSEITFESKIRDDNISELECEDYSEMIYFPTSSDEISPAELTKLEVFVEQVINEFESFDVNKLELKVIGSHSRLPFRGIPEDLSDEQNNALANLRCAKTVVEVIKKLSELNVNQSTTMVYFEMGISDEPNKGRYDDSQEDRSATIIFTHCHGNLE